MRKLTSGEITRIETSQVNTYNSKCNIQHITISKDAYGDVTESISSTDSNINCGFYLTGGMIFYRNSIILVEYDAVIRLPLTQTIRINDKIVITSILGTTTNITFKLNEYPEIGESCTVIKLKRVSV
jgi:hypothetical protein